MAERIESYRNLLVWQHGIDVVESVYRHTQTYPREEAFGLTAQTRRAATSIPANIAEGYGRQTRAAYANFLRIAQGSLKELETHLIIAHRVGIGRSETTEAILAQTDELGRMLQVLIKKIAT